MKLVKKASVTVALCLLGFSSFSAYADTASDKKEAQLIDNLTQKTTMLQQQVQELQSELKTLKPHRKKYNSVVTKTGMTNVSNNSVILQQAMGASKTSYIPVQVVGDEHPVVLGGTPVTTSPYLGVRSQFDASDLIVNIPPVNEDLRLLQQRKKLTKAYCDLGEPLPDHPYVDMSGELQATAMELKPYTGSSTSNVDLTDAELDTAVMFNRWVTGFLTFNYDNSPPALGPVVSNSRVFMDRGFITIGNLDKFPLYTTIGQLYVPFGKYSNMWVSTPVTESLGRIKDRAIVEGFDATGTTGGFYGSLFTFRGDSSTNAGGPTQLNQLGANLDYMLNEPEFNTDFGASYITNMTDSLGMQQTSAPAGSFAGFGGGTPAGAETLVHRVPAYDLHANLGVGNYSLIAEFVSATTAFSAANMTMNGHGAYPRALDTEFGYNFTLFGRPTVVAVGYDQTKDALALLLPEKSYIAVLNTSFWRDTIQSLEFRHDVNYASGDTATGQGTVVTATGLGNSSNMVSLQMSAFF